jgi:hypothetical protein
VITVLRPRIKRRDNGVPEMGSKNVQNCVTSFMGNPYCLLSLFLTKVTHAAFMCLLLRFVLFWRKEIGGKSARNRKMLVKLTKAL